MKMANKNVEENRDQMTEKFKTRKIKQCNCISKLRIINYYYIIKYS